ncbi:hypothetical protein OKW21_006231 [Catalinimonas alkaloidigena]|uniref:PRC-barrel domain-containing protein n=1 Tax=Catalinimonas alkaloidigena TaxID=1075417 RepID=UPI002405E0E9|nr:PRC-barrel domain-containing protein [Catalinimonas alkaloidigena]MDF9800968.1 hypothetical protein [Catalinimonas alkaloidigena]
MLNQYLSTRDNILSNTVHDETGEEIGKIYDILINPEDNQAKIAILSEGGILGLGSDYIALPFHLLRFNPQASDVALKVAAHRIKNAPSIDIHKLKGSDDQELEKLYNYYGEKAMENQSHESADGRQYVQERQSNHPHKGYEGSAKITGEQPKNNPESKPADDMDYDKLKWGKKK